MNKYLIKGNLLLLFVVLVSCRPQNSVTDSPNPVIAGFTRTLHIIIMKESVAQEQSFHGKTGYGLLLTGLIYHGGPVTNFMKSQTHLEFAHVQKVWEGPLPTD